MQLFNQNFKILINREKKLYLPSFLAADEISKKKEIDIITIIINKYQQRSNHNKLKLFKLKT